MSTLLIDLETSSNEGDWWHGMHEVNPIKIRKHGHIISYAWKWEGDKKVQVRSCRNMAHKELIRSLFNLISKADYVVGHNLSSFDDRVANTDFLTYGWVVPRHRVIDTLRIARTYFRFNSNKLNDIAQFLGIGSKLKHPGYPMWEGCRDGDKHSWLIMEKYNAHDVVLLEAVYDRFKPWIDRPKLARIR